VECKASPSLNTVCSIIDDIKISNEIIYKASLYGRNEFVFFQGKNNNQIIVLQIYTDFHKLNIFLFGKENIPEMLVNFYSYGGPNSVDKNKIKIADENFITKKGAKLGMSSKEIIDIYGLPHFIEIIKFNPEKKLRFKWQLLGIASASHFGNIPKEKVCEKIDVLYEISIDFINDKAVMIHIRNDPV